MTVQEIYDYAFANMCLNENIDKVIKQIRHHKRNFTNTNNTISDIISIFGNKVEYSYDDVVELFSS